MSRQNRIFLENVPCYIKINANKDIKLFKHDNDYNYFISKMFEISKLKDIKVHAFCLLENSIDFLISSTFKENISRFVQSLNLRYVKYYNTKYNNKGRLWENRYKSSLVEMDSYFYDVIKYIEKLPLKENIIDDLEKYKYSTIRNHLEHLRPSNNKNFDTYNYTKLFYTIDDKKIQNFIETSIKNQNIIGRKLFIKEIEKKTNKTLIKKKRGRPRKETNLINTLKGKNMYKNLVVLDKVKHNNLKLKPVKNLNFAKNVGFIPILTSEIEKLNSTFPVVFTSSEKPELVALVGLSSDSLAINNQGKWISSYIPAFIRKYPFSMASVKGNPNQKIILMDQESELLDNSEGTRLFDDEENGTEVLNNVINFLTSYSNESIKTKQFIDLILKEDILDEREIAIGEGDEKKILVNGFKVIDKEKLNKLDDKKLAEWSRIGILNLIEEHIKSLNHIQNLFNLLQTRQK